jgi:hypothetical protein
MSTGYVLVAQLHLPIKRAAVDHGVHWELVSAIIAHESNAAERRYGQKAATCCWVPVVAGLAGWWWSP